MNREIEHWLKYTLPEFQSIRESFRFEDLQMYDWRTKNEKGVVIVVHGFTESAIKMQEVCWHFHRLGYDVIAYDQRGHGYSSRMTTDTSLVHIDRFDRYVQDLMDLTAFVRRHTREPIVLYGHSMGGAVAAIAASRMSGHIHKVILSSPMVRPRTGPVPWSAAQLVARVLAAKDPQTYVPGTGPYQTETFEQSAGTCEPLFDWYRGIRQQDVHYQTAAPSCGWLTATAEVERELRKTTDFPPCLLIQCKEDAFVVNKSQDWFAGKVHAQKSVFDHVKHEIYNSPDKTRQAYWAVIEEFVGA